MNRQADSNDDEASRIREMRPAKPLYKLATCSEYKIIFANENFIIKKKDYPITNMHDYHIKFI